MVMGNKKYFAFISYKREDEEWAKWFQNELENYHLPSTLNGRTDISDILEEIPEAFRPPKKDFRPVFRDIDELKAGNLPEQIYSALNDSLNLVVICSPRSAKSEWVNKEIDDFIDIGEEEGTDNIKNIFPFIIDGIPHAGDERECFPIALRELSNEQERIGGNINEGGSVSDENRERAFVKVLAGMLPQSVSFDMLWDRYDRDKKAREVKEKEQRDQLLIAQSRFIAEKAIDLVDKGDSYLASFLSLNALPLNLKTPNRPYVLEAETALRKSLRKENAFLLGHSHSVISSVYSKDGKKIYSVSWDKRLCVWDAMSGRLIYPKKKHLGNINSISISNDGSTLVTTSDDKMAIIWDPETLKLKAKRLSHDAPVRHASFSPCGRYLLTALNDGNVCIWDLRGHLIKMFEADENSVINTVLMDHANRIITVSHGWNNEITWCNVKIWKWDKDSNAVKCCKLLSPRWPDVQNENGSLSTEWHSDNIGLWFPSLAYCCKRNLLLFASEKHIYVWQLSDFMLLKILSLSSTITAFAINENDNLIALATSSNKVLFQEIPEDGVSWGKPKLVGLFEHGITDLSFCPDKRHLLLVSFDIGVIRQMDLGTNRYIKETSIMADSICFISNDSFVVASSQDVQPGIIYDIKLGTRKTLIPENIMKKNKEQYGISYEDHNQIIFNKKGKKIYCLGEGDVYVYNLYNKNGENQSIDFPSHFRCCFKTISEDGRRAVFAFKDGTMFLVDVITRKRIKLLEKTYNHTLIHSACFSSDSKLIATTSNEGLVRVYNAKDGTYVQKMRPIQTLWGNSIEFSHRGDMIICASQDYYVYIWKIDKREKQYSLKRRLSGHGERVCRASFSSDGGMAVSASPSKVIIWDVESGIPLEIIELETKAHDLNFVQFDPTDSRIFVSCDGKLSIIEFPKLQKLIDATRKRFRYRKLGEQERKQYYLE